MQKSIVDFVRYMNPNPEEEDKWEVYHNDEPKVMNLGKPDQSRPNFEPVVGIDQLDSKKCNFWQDSPYHPKGSRKAQFVEQSDSYKEYL
jgi:hypothetical protein